ncbi:hypothetical protein [Amycolatopsis albispora]|uniref:Uncharacterized protein n=1 Tax=Amycolatopsis albispora TaxID=1804986 RepID=A0A344LG18_9PSEU|nr:hypothetical protein [Amycolatopsis albispora]AXB46992.1 hypothetical protein A4R43_34860 [Amycolatopsis albispora]
MNQRDKTLLIVLGFFAVFVPVAVGLSLDWPVWLWSLLVVLSLGVVLIVRTSIVDRIRQEEARDARLDRFQVPEPPPEPSGYEEVMINPTYLPSALSDYRFVFSAKVWWRFSPNTPPRPHANPAGLACSLIVQQAQAEAARMQPQDTTLLEHRLSGLLGVARPDRDNLLEASANSVKVTLMPDDEARLQSLAEVRKSRAVWEHERDYERNKRQYLGEDVLKDTGSAVVWWLSKQETAIQETVDLIGKLAQLSAAANNTEIPPLFRQFVTENLTGDVTEHASAEHAEPNGRQGAWLSLDPALAPAGATVQPTRHLEMWMTEIGLAPGNPTWDLLAYRLASTAEATGMREAAIQIRKDFGVDVPDPADAVPEEEAAEAETPAQGRLDDTVDSAGHGEDNRPEWPGTDGPRLSYE